jgi:lipid-A-disaccharide synthase
MRCARPPLIFMIAGEASGDAIGARLMAALRREYPGPVEFAGVGGERMASEGLKTLFPMSDLTVMGFAEVVPALPRLAMRLVQTISAARAAKPDVVLGIDSKAFCLRVLGALASGRNKPGPLPSVEASDTSTSPPPALVQCVAPSAWAFSDAPSRAAKLAGVVDELLVLLPFEACLFEAAGVPCTFIGHPSLSNDEGTALSSEPRQRVGSAPPPPHASEAGDALCLLPGSRQQEVVSNLPPMLRAAEQLLADRRSNGISRLLLPAPPSVRSLVEAHLAARPALPVHVCSDADRFDAYRDSRLAIACCGTVNVELARARVPQVAVYSTSWITSAVIRHVIKPTLTHATLPNIINYRRDGCGARGLIPELLLEDCTPGAVVGAAQTLLEEPAAAASQVAASARALDDLVAIRDETGEAVPFATVAARALIQHHLVPRFSIR